MTANMHEIISDQIKASIEVKFALMEDGRIISQIEELAKMCILTLKSGGKIIFAGNGGSFADAQHLSAELTSHFLFDRPPLASIALGTNSSSITAIGNDYGYDKIFSRELAANAKQGDMFIPISTSGNSPNIIHAIATAKEIGIPIIALTGQGGGGIKTMCECLCIPSMDTARIQECHIMIGHILCGIIERDMFTENMAYEI
jgi:D-sedoheptulose 7-phosphate isomerase